MVNSFNLSFVKYDPQIASILGRGAAIFISSLQFLMNNGKLGIEHGGKKWIFYSAHQWAESIGYSSRQIERIASKLKDKGIITTKKLSGFKANRINYYTIDEAKLTALLQNIENQEKSAGKALINNSVLSTNDKVRLCDKMSEPSRHNDGFTTKNTNKELKNNKSDNTEKETLSDEVNDCLNEQVNQVENMNKRVGEKEKISSTSVKTTTAQDMVAVWNEILPESKTNISKLLAPLLVSAFRKKFNEDINQWKRYCKMIASSSYLTGKEFRLSIWWALKYTTIERITNFEFGVKEVSEPILYSEKEALEHIHGVNEPEKCKEVRAKLLKVYGVMAYKNWFQELSFLLDTNGRVSFMAKTKFINDYVKNNFWQVLG